MVQNIAAPHVPHPVHSNHAGAVGRDETAPLFAGGDFFPNALHNAIPAFQHIHAGDAGEFFRYMGGLRQKTLDAAGADALILADLGAFAMAGKYAPHCERHISTQQSIANYVCAQSWFDLGAQRVVLARELSLPEIITIREKVSPELELETFCHGAMCVSYSGRCLLSNYMTGRDSNRGQCAQPCRYQYALMEEKRPGQYFDITETDKGTYILNANDLCMAEQLDKMAAAGVDSIKIEGRAKSHYYVAVTANAYRGALDSLKTADGDWKCPGWVTEELNKISHRTYSTGFYFGTPQNAQTYQNAGYIRDYSVAAIVEGYENGCITAVLKNKFLRGQEFDCLEPGKPPFTVSANTLFDGDGNEIEVAPHPMMKLKIPFDRPVKPGAMLRMKY